MNLPGRSARSSSPIGQWIFSALSHAYMRMEANKLYASSIPSVFRSPRQCNQNAQTGEKTTRPEDSGFTELELPTAMKLTKIPGTRSIRATLICICRSLHSKFAGELVFFTIPMLHRRAQTIEVDLSVSSCNPSFMMQMYVPISLR